MRRKRRLWCRSKRWARAARITSPLNFSDKIYADNGSIVGSIGVIAQWVNYGDLLKWAKLKDVVLKTGEFKDTGNPARDLTPNEQAYMQSLIDNMFGQFVKAVADVRGMKFGQQIAEVDRQRQGLDR